MRGGGSPASRTRRRGPLGHEEERAHASARRATARRSRRGPGRSREEPPPSRGQATFFGRTAQRDNQLASAQSRNGNERPRACVVFIALASRLSPLSSGGGPRRRPDDEEADDLPRQAGLGLSSLELTDEDCNTIAHALAAGYDQIPNQEGRQDAEGHHSEAEKSAHGFREDLERRFH